MGPTALLHSVLCHASGGHSPASTDAQIRASSAHVGFAVDKVALRQAFQVLRLSPVNIIPPGLSILIYHLGDEPR
jgi:hypothetical protein